MSRTSGLLRAGEVVAFPFESAVALAGIIAGVRGLVDPLSLPVAVVLPAISSTWSVLFILGGLGVLLGRALYWPKFEAASCLIFGLAAAFETLAYVFLKHGDGTAFWPGVVSAEFCALSTVRGVMMALGYRWVRLPPLRARG